MKTTHSIAGLLMMASALGGWTGWLDPRLLVQDRGYNAGSIRAAGKEVAIMPVAPPVDQAALRGAYGRQGSGAHPAPAVEPARAPFDAATLRMLEQLIPFGMRCSIAAGRQCDPMDVEVIVQTDASGHDLDYRWRVLDDGVVQMECGDFYDLYYRCDAPACLRLRVLTENDVGQIVSEKRGHVCLE